METLEATETGDSARAAIAELVETFDFLEEWTQRYAHIIDLGRKLPEFPEAERTEDLLVQGCQSRVWMDSRLVNGRLQCRAVSDAAIVSGLIHILLSVYNNRTPDEILATSPDFLRDLGLDTHLSPSRRNGLFSMIRRIQRAAEEARA